MRFVVDESVDAPIAEALRQSGHDVWCVQENCVGIDDDTVLSMANECQAMLVTADKDFGELVYRLGRAHHGILLLRLSGLSPTEKASLVVWVLGQYETEIAHGFCVLTRHAFRVRHEPTV